MPDLFDTLIDENLRRDHRTPKNLAFLKALLEPIKWLYEVFLVNSEAILMKVSHNSQIIYLEHMLNFTVFGSYIGINIIDTANIEYTYLANKDEGYDPEYLFNTVEGDPATTGGYSPVFIGNSEEYDTQFDFIVYMPPIVYQACLANNEEKLNQIKSIVNYYKLAGKRYKIESQ